MGCWSNLVFDFLDLSKLEYGVFCVVGGGVGNYGVCVG